MFFGKAGLIRDSQVFTYTTYRIPPMIHYLGGATQILDYSLYTVAIERLSVLILDYNMDIDLL